MALARNEPLPDWFEERPDLGRLEEWYLQAYGDLSTERHHELGRIPWSAIRSYAYQAGLEPCIMDHFEAVIRALEEEHLDDLAKQQAKKG